ncbi:energy transducer TonB [Vibrio hippocampi]|uniref:Protein TonB n=1 Tax=Vibrio hippocampi TaxID=654686 RepID=A0ABN8DNS1_9VIBR|nr:energy transducer TonB [Vibrio hippocampi]CAH0529106.1 hypothetical protein VHP8226_03054 [Vibrio hippocampi]
MFRWLIAIPLASLVMVLLFTFMATMIDHRQSAAPKVNAPLSFNMVMLEQEQELQRRKRTVPEPPKPPEMPPETPLSQTSTASNQVSSMAAPSELNLNTAVQGLAIAVPAFGEFSVQTPMQTNQQAMPLYRVEPNYPARALKRKVEGYVLMRFTIDATGRATDIQVVEGNPARMFDREAIRALKKWKYQPKVEGGKAVSQPNQTVKLEFRFAK